MTTSPASARSEQCIAGGIQGEEAETGAAPAAITDCRSRARRALWLGACARRGARGLTAH